MKRRALAVAVALSLSLASLAPSACAPRAPAAERAIASAFEERRSGVQVEGSGTVVRLLPDDLNGGRHQRFILELQSGQTLLISHNIDIAPPLDGLGVGDTVRFAGVYEWNRQGGVVHWTHHDPDGSHEAGWLEHGGRRYQ